MFLFKRSSLHSKKGPQDPLLATAPCVCLPIYHYIITLPHAARSPMASPPLLLQTTSDQNWMVATAWEQGVGKITNWGNLFQVTTYISHSEQGVVLLIHKFQPLEDCYHFAPWRI